MGVRMVPIGALFGRFRRLVHDLSRDLGKQIEFVTTGEETELDKTVIERLADPLVHLIRNAIDHGIEDTADRAPPPARPTQGRIELAAAMSGAEVLVTVARRRRAASTRARIRAKAEEQGLMRRRHARRQRDPSIPLRSRASRPPRRSPRCPAAASAWTWSSAPSRACAARSTSSTKPGQGTTVTLRLPLTLAIIDGLLVRVGDGRYVIPLSAVEECVELTAEDERSRGRNFLNIRGDLVPFLRLRETCSRRATPDRHQKTIIISIGETHVGLVVDQIIGNHQTVIKRSKPATNGSAR